MFIAKMQMQHFKTNLTLRGIVKTNNVRLHHNLQK